MKKNYFPRFFLLLLCCHVLCAVAEGAPVLSDLFMASGVNRDGSPQEKVTEYSSSAPLFAAFAECRDVAAGTQVRFVWYFTPPGAGAIRFAENVVKSSVRQETALFHSTVALEKKWPEGEYAVEAYLDGGKTVKKVAFLVIQGVSTEEAGNRPPEGKEFRPSSAGMKGFYKPPFRTDEDAAREKEDRVRREKTLAEKEAAFLRNPADFSAVLELADAYASMNDAASLSLALALYKGLAETSPSDLILSRLADAYARNYLYDRAFSTALRRTWNPMVSPAGAIVQILLLASATGDWDRGIECMLLILGERDDERELTLLALASLSMEKGRGIREESLRSEYKESVTAILDEVEASLPAFTDISTMLLRLRKELEEL